MHVYIGFCLYGVHRLNYSTFNQPNLLTQFLLLFYFRSYNHDFTCTPLRAAIHVCRMGDIANIHTREFRQRKVVLKGGPVFFLLLFTSKFQIDKQKATPKRIVFIVSVSGALIRLSWTCAHRFLVLLLHIGVSFIRYIAINSFFRRFLRILAFFSTRFFFAIKICQTKNICIHILPIYLIWREKISVFIHTKLSLSLRITAEFNDKHYLEQIIKTPFKWCHWKM